jgi:molecular chaperone GrpE (heat shock protein)
VLLLLRARGIEPTAAEQDRIRACQDEEMLSRSVCIAAGLSAPLVPDPPAPTLSVPTAGQGAAHAEAVPTPSHPEAPPRVPQRSSLPALPLGGDIHLGLGFLCNELVLLFHLGGFKQGTGAEPAMQGFFQGLGRLFPLATEARNAVLAAAPPSQPGSTVSVYLIQTHLLPLLNALYQCQKERAQSPAVSTEAALGDLLDLALATMTGCLEALGVVVHQPLGEPFDARVHEVADGVEHPQAPPGIIVAVTQLGVWDAGELLQAARVVVVGAPRAGLPAGAPQPTRRPAGSLAEAVAQALPAPAGLDAGPPGAPRESLRPTPSAAPLPSQVPAFPLPLASLPRMPVDPSFLFALSIFHGELAALLLLVHWKQRCGASSSGALHGFFEHLSRTSQQASEAVKHLHTVYSPQAPDALSVLPQELLESDLLPLLDHLYHGRQMLAQTPALVAEQGLRELVDALLALYLSILRVQGVVAEEPLGEQFDRRSHALSGAVESPDAPPGSIVWVEHPAVWLDRDLIRAARVVVAGPPGRPEEPVANQTPGAESG